MKQIPLTQGKFALVDDEDYDFLSKWKWHYNGEYALRSIHLRGQKKHKTCILHRVINETPDGFQTDHINGNKLDNRRVNLRTVNQSQNNMNRKPHRETTSKYKGVSWCSRDSKWMACIRNEGKTKNLGRYLNEIDAASAYDVAARKVFGEFARLNFP